MNPILKFLYDDGRRRNADPNPDGREKERRRQRNLPIPEDIISDPDVSYRTEKGGTLQCNVLMPGTHGEDKLPVIVMIHGGGLLFGDRRGNLPFGIRMAELGYLVYCIEYRLLYETDFFGALADVNHGLQFVRDSLDQYNGDPERITVIGESAGGLLALYSAAMCGSGKIREQMGVFCPDINIRSLILSSGMLYTTRMDYIAAVYKRDLYGKRTKDKEFMKYMNPENPEVIDSLPRVCLVSGYGDFLRSMTLRYAKALDKAHHPNLLLDYDNKKKLPHAFATLMPMLAESRDAIDRMDTWMKE